MTHDGPDPDTHPLNEWLRGRHALTGTAPQWDPEVLPDDPTVLFGEWLRAADAAGVPEPHTVTLATVDGAGVPDARTLILKRVDEHGWAVASTRSSRKGAQLGAAPAAALNFWWQPQVRAVRVRGRVEEASAEESAADLAARSPAARGRGRRRLGSLAHRPRAHRVLAGLPGSPPHASGVRPRRHRLVPQRHGRLSRSVD